MDDVVAAHHLCGNNTSYPPSWKKCFRHEHVLSCVNALRKLATSDYLHPRFDYPAVVA